MTLYSTIEKYSKLIENGRSDRDVIEHGYGEMYELLEELQLEEDNETPGSDGIEGEAIDVINCMIDILVRRGWTEERVAEYAEKKCKKWAANNGIDV